MCPRQRPPCFRLFSEMLQPHDRRSVRPPCCLVDTRPRTGLLHSHQPSSLLQGHARFHCVTLVVRGARYHCHPSYTDAWLCGAALGEPGRSCSLVGSFPWSEHHLPSSFPDPAGWPLMKPLLSWWPAVCHLRSPTQGDMPTCLMAPATEAFSIHHPGSRGLDPK